MYTYSVLQQLFTALSLAMHTLSALITHLQKYHQTVLLKSIFHCWVRHAVRRHLIRKMFTRWKHAAKGMNYEEFVTEAHVTCTIISICSLTRSEKTEEASRNSCK